MRITILAIVLYGLADAASAGEVYKCTGSNGTAIYSESPCAGDAKKVAVRETAPKEKVPRTLQTWCDSGAVTPTILNQCLGYWRPRLRDPSSLSVRRANEVMSAEYRERAVFIDLYAKNGFGGFSYMQARCGLDKKSGKFDASLTEEWRSFAIDELPQVKERGLEIVSCGPEDLRKRR